MPPVSVDLEPAEAAVVAVSDEQLNREARRRLVVALRPLWERRWLLTKATIWAALLSLALAFALPSRYESTARLMPSETNTNLAMLQVLGGAAGMASDLLGMKSPGALLVGVLTSDSVADSLVNRFDLRRAYSCRKYSRAREILAGRTHVAEDHKSGIITIQVSDRDPAHAAAMAQAYVDELNRVLTHVSTSAARRERLFLEERLAGVKRDLDSAQLQLSEFSSRNATVDLKDQGHAMVEAGARLQGELIAEQSQLQGLQQIYGDQNVRVRSVEARIAGLKRQIEKLGGAASTDADGESPLYPSLRKLPILGVSYADLYRQTRIEEALYETLTKQYELARVQEAKEIPTVRVLDEPKVPEERSFPPRTLMLVAGTLFGLAVAAAWVVGRQIWTAADDGDPLKTFGLELRRELGRSWADARRKIRLGNRSKPAAEESNEAPGFGAEVSEAGTRGIVH